MISGILTLVIAACFFILLGGLLCAEAEEVKFNVGAFFATLVPSVLICLCLVGILHCNGYIILNFHGEYVP